MAYWDSENKKIVYSEPKVCEYNPNWECLDCGCCNGLQWGGEYPTECSDCNGSGGYYRHIKSGVLAQYPGGPFLGREPLNERN